MELEYIFQLNPFGGVFYLHFKLNFKKILFYFYSKNSFKSNRFMPKLEVATKSPHYLSLMPCLMEINSSMMVDRKSSGDRRNYGDVE